MPLSASFITCCGLRCVRVISRMLCWANMGLIEPPAFLRAATWPGVASPVRSPKPKLAARPRTVGAGTVAIARSPQCIADVCMPGRRLRKFSNFRRVPPSDLTNDDVRFNLNQRFCVDKLADLNDGGCGQ